MEQFSAKDLSKTFQQSVNYGICDIATDSREAKNGDLFVAIKGENVDGHNFVKQALDNGAAVALVEHDVTGVNPSRLIKVASTLEALNDLAKYNLSRCNAKIIGVTGSVGKTTTRNLICHSLKSAYEHVYTNRRNFNSKIGLPLCAAMMPINTQFGVFEMGMSTTGDLRHLVQIVPPNVSVLTKICEAHLEFFNCLWGIARAKSEIFETEKPQDFAIIPTDSPFTQFLKNRATEYGVKNVLTFGAGNAKIISEDHSENLTHVKAEILGEPFEYAISFGNVSDSLAAILAVKSVANISLNDIKSALGSFRSLDNRGGIIHIKNRDIVVINDTYNACPTSLKAGIRAMSYRNAKRRILVVGDMLELGKDAPYMHANISATIDKYGVDKVFVCGELAKHLFDNLQPNKRGEWAENSQQLAEKVADFVQAGDCILVKGSHSMHMDFIVNYLLEHLEK